MNRSHLLSISALCTGALFSLVAAHSQDSEADGDGCCSREGSASGEVAVASVGQPSAVSRRAGELELLTESLGPLVDHFNATKEHPRVVALLSPTCAGCIHAAKALRSEIVEKRKDADLSVSIVWVPMLASDNEQAAAQAAVIFDDERVAQFYDPERLSGIAWSKNMFASLARDALSDSDSNGLTQEWLEALARRPETVPVWDVVFFYPKGTEWKGVTPIPADWSMQIGFHAEKGTGPTGTFVVRALDRKTVRSDWFDEVRAGLDALLTGIPRSEGSSDRIAVPKDGPRFFSEALERASEKEIPVVIAFEAEWCAPCQRLKKETLNDPAVAAALAHVELVHVDVDANPKLASFYGVQTIPDVLFLNREQVVADRLQSFEAAPAFLARLNGVLKASRSEVESTSRPGSIAEELVQ